MDLSNVTNWLPSSSQVEAVKPYIELLESLAVTIAAGVAVWGINSWRREFLFRKEYELAEEVLPLFYKARDLIRGIRNPFGASGEGQTRKPIGDETPAEKRARDEAWVVFERYEKNRDTFDRLNALRYRFMAKFGRESIKPFDELQTILRNIFSSAMMLSFYLPKEEFDGLPEEDLKKRREIIEENRAIFWQLADDKTDPIAQRLDKIIDEIDAQWRTRIARRK